MIHPMTDITHKIVINSANCKRKYILVKMTAYYNQPADCFEMHIKLNSKTGIVVHPHIEHKHGIPMAMYLSMEDVAGRLATAINTTANQLAMKCRNLDVRKLHITHDGMLTYAGRYGDGAGIKI